MELYQSGYYPRHSRTPNLLVCALYELGYLVADFGPMCVNLFDTVYTNIRKLFAFIVGLLIELSTVIVLLGTIVFSIAHSIQLLREAGATGGLEYIGVVMFEVVFISSTATLTKSLMTKKRSKFWLIGLIFSLLGFLLGIAFVWWSNITGMAPTRTGKIIGFCTPILLIIVEGILAFRYLSQSDEEDETKVMELLRRSRLTVEDLQLAIQLYQTNKAYQQVETPQNDSHSHEKNISQPSSYTPQLTLTEATKNSHTSHSERENSLPLTEEKFSQEVLAHEDLSQQNDEEISSQNEKSHTETKKEKSSQDEITHSAEALRKEKTDEPEFSQTSNSRSEVDGLNSSQKEKPSQPEESSQEEEKSSQKGALTLEDSHTSQEENSHTEVDSHTSQEKTHTQKTSHKKSTSQTKKYALRKKSHNKSSQSDQELLTDLEEIKKVALRMFAEKGGTYPSIRELKDEAPCSEWLSRKALNQLNPKKRKAN